MESSENAEFFFSFCSLLVELISEALLASFLLGDNDFVEDSTLPFCLLVVLLLLVLSEEADTTTSFAFAAADFVSVDDTLPFCSFSLTADESGNSVAFPFDSFDDEGSASVELAVALLVLFVLLALLLLLLTVESSSVSILFAADEDEAPFEELGPSSSFGKEKKK